MLLSGLVFEGWLGSQARGMMERGEGGMSRARQAGFLILLIFTVVMCVQDGLADVLVMRSGKKFEGVVTEDGDNYVIQLASGGKVTLPKSAVHDVRQETPPTVNPWLERVPPPPFHLDGRPEVYVGTGYARVAIAIAFNANGRLLATAGSGGVVRLWDVSAGREIRSLTARPYGKVASLAFSRDSRLIAGYQGSYMSEPAIVKLWEVETGREVRTLTGDNIAGEGRVAFSPCGGMLAVGGRGTLRLWDLRSGSETMLLKGSSLDYTWGGEVTSLCFSPDGRLLAATHDWDHVKVWETATWREVGLAKEVRCSHAAFSPDGATIALALGQNVSIWDVGTNRELRAFGKTTAAIDAVAFSSDGRLVAANTQLDGVWVWDAQSGSETCRIHSGDGGVLALSPEGPLAACARGGRLFLYDLTSGREIRTFGSGSYSSPPVAFSPDGRLLASGSHRGAELWDVEAGRRVDRLEGSAGPGVFSPVGGMLATASGIVGSPTWRLTGGGAGKGTVKLWDLQASRPLRTFTTDSLNAMVFSPDGRWLATGGAAKVARLWDVETGREIAQMAGHSGVLASVAFHPEGKLLAAGYEDGGITVWDVASRRELRSFPKHVGPARVVFSPNGELLVTEDHNRLHVWEWETGRKVHTIGGHGAPAAVFSPDGQSIALTRAEMGPQDPIQVRDVATGQLMSTCKGSVRVGSIACGPNGRWVAGGSSDRAIRLWELDSGALVATFVSGQESGWICFLPNGYYRCSRGGWENVSFVFGSRAYPFEQFDLMFNRPDIVMERLGCEDKELIAAAKKAYQRRLARMGLKEEDLSSELHLPEVAIDRESLPLVTAEQRVELKVKAWDDKYALDCVMVWINDVPVSYGERGPGFSVRARQSHRINATIRGELCAGTNKIQASVINARGVESLKDTVYVECTAEVGKPKLWVLAIGVSDYKVPALKLRYAAKDAEDVASLPSTGAARQRFEERFAEVNVLTLTDSDATRGRILAAKQFLARSGVDDVAVVFAAGHGFLDKKYDYYFGTYDVDPHNPSERGLLFDELNGLLAAIPARNKLLLIDTCHAGELDPDVVARAKAVPVAQVEAPALERGASVMVRAFDRGVGVTVAEEHRRSVSNASIIQEDFFADLRRGTGAVVISSCSGDEYSVEGEKWRNGVFTYAVLECLQEFKGDVNGDGRIVVSELRDYVAARVRELTGGGQNPTVRQENLANDFVLVAR